MTKRLQLAINMALQWRLQEFAFSIIKNIKIIDAILKFDV